MAKGIRVNQLAKELNVPSKSILDRLRSEGLGEKAPNHMSVLALGLAESVREWFQSGQGVSTAVEVAAPAETEVAVKPKTSRSRKKKAEDSQEHEAEPTSAVETAVETTEEKAPAAHHPRKHAHPHKEKETTAEAAPVAPVETPAVVAPSAPESTPVAPAPVATETPAAPVAVEKPAPVAPAAGTALAAPAHPPTGHSQGHGDHPRVARPTVTLANRPGQAHPPVARKPVVPAPKLHILEPAKIQGPRVVREEKPENVPVPRPRRAPGGFGPASDEPAPFTQARPTTGRGVKSADDEEEENKKKATGKGSRTLSSRRRGPDGRRGEAMEKLKEYTEADLIERRDRLLAATQARATFDSHLKKRAERGQHGPAKTIVQKGQPVEVEEPITVKNLSAALGIKSNDIISKLMKQGVFANINQALDRETAESMALEYGIELHIKRQETMEEQLQKEFASRVNVEKLVTRPPVVTILGHVDHGKTSLLDKIRHANVAAGEAGGITQHTAAWMVQLGDKRVTFIDTPGHQAFTSMRARGATMTDVVVLVVSAAEGVQPQTIESINHARAAKVPIVVAMNKIDRPDANEQQVLGQLAGQGLNPVEWGGDIEVIRTSAHTGQGIPELIEILDYQSQLLELKADPTAPARGTVIESRMDEGLGSVATVLVQDGTLKVGDIIISGPGFGRIRSLFNDRGESIPEAGPSTPVIVSGMASLPNAGEKFYVVENMDRARSIAEEREHQTRQQQLANKTQVSLDSILKTMDQANVKEIKLIIKGDVQGSVETLAKTVTDANTSEVKVVVIHAAVGGITESDVELADASGAVIIGFHVAPDEGARVMAEQRRVEIRLYRVIYEIFDDLKKALSGLLEPEIREKLHGHAEVRQVFKVSKVGNIAGCMVTDGHIQRGSKIRLIRDGVVVVEDLVLDSLRRVKEDVREVKAGFECGIKLVGYDDIKIGDRFEAYARETIQRTL